MLNPSLITSLVLAATIAWDPTGTRVAGRQTFVPQVAPDGNGGVFLAWEDQRAVFTRGADCYFQQLNSSGVSRPDWLTDGMPACMSNSDEAFESMMPDGAGGLYVFWAKDQRAEGRGLDNYVQRFGPDGQPHPSWPVYGVGFATQPWDDIYAQTCSDGQNGFIVVWEDYRPGPPFFGQANCRAKRILANGVTAPGWPDTGVAVSASPGGAQALRRVVSDGSGGAYVVWDDARNTSLYDAYVQRLTATGKPSPGWPAEGLRLCPIASLKFIIDAVSDGNHGLVLVWDDDRERPAGVDWTTPYGDIYAARLNPDGTHAEGWPLDGLPICVHSGVQWYARMCPDGTGGAVMAWTDSRNGPGQIFVQRVLGSGQIAPGWPADGALAGSTLGHDDVDPKLASDGAGGAYVYWQDDTYSRAYAQHFLGTGGFGPGWASAGLRLVNVDGWFQHNLNICPDGAGNAIVVWKDTRYNAAGNPEGSIRAQKLVNDGLVPTQLALQNIEATAERVRLTWWGAGPSQATLTVERSEHGASWLALGLASSADADQLTYEDFTIEPGQRYGYRLVDTASRVIVAPEWVDVPAAARFALAGAQPNPSRGRDLSVGFSLATRGAGVLELLDLAGRRTAWRDIGALAAGNHTARFAEASGFAPGIYWLRLTQGANRVTARVVILE